METKAGSLGTLALAVCCVLLGATAWAQRSVPALQGGGAPTPAQQPSGAACTFVGQWQGTFPAGPYPFSGQALSVEVRADGSSTWSAAAGFQNLARWQVANGTLSLNNNNPHPSPYACAPADTGQYSMVFAPGCRAVTLSLSQDACRGRTLQLDHLTLTRR